MRKSVLFAGCSFALVAALTGSARADEDDDKRAAVVDRLLDTSTGDAGQTWSAFEEPCGMDCTYLAYGGCSLVEGAADCEVKVFDADARKYDKTITVREADRNPDKLAAAKATLTTALAQVGTVPMWLDEHRFDTPAQPFTTWNVTFKWDWKKMTLTVLDGKKVFKKIKAPRLRKGLGLTSVAIWYHIADDGSAGDAVLRVHGEGDEGEMPGLTSN
jgi:hypothetical protein